MLACSYADDEYIKKMYLHTAASGHVTMKHILSMKERNPSSNLDSHVNYFLSCNWPARTRPTAMKESAINDKKPFHEVM